MMRSSFPFKLDPQRSSRASFAETVQLAAAAKLRNHVRSCYACQRAPWACLYRKTLEQERSILK